jgi:hypothetical protein
MGGVLRPRGRTILPVLLCLSWAGCSRHAGVRSTEDGAVQATQHPAPFREGDDATPHSETAEAQDYRSVSDSGVPFRDSQSLPAGTLLTVRLKTPICSDPPGANSKFVALVDDPIIVEGTTVVPRGASVAGRIESARSSTMKPNHGYVRLTLDLVDIEGKELPIRTSSLFARGNPGEPQGRKAVGVNLEQGRRLTFRLTEPVYVASQSPDSHR